MIIAHKSLNPILCFPELCSETFIIIKIFTSKGHLFIGSAYLSPENTKYHQEEIINCMKFLSSKYKIGNNNYESIPIIIYGDFN